MPPEDKKKIWRTAYKVFISGRKGFRRFSTSRSRFWDKLIEYRWKLARDEMIAELKHLLENKVKDLEEKIKHLDEVQRERKSLRTRTGG